MRKACLRKHRALLALVARGHCIGTAFERVFEPET